MHSADCSSKERAAVPARAPAILGRFGVDDFREAWCVGFRKLVISRNLNGVDQFWLFEFTCFPTDDRQQGAECTTSLACGVRAVWRFLQRPGRQGSLYGGCKHNAGVLQYTSVWLSTVCNYEGAWVFPIVQYYHVLSFNVIMYHNRFQIIMYAYIYIYVYE